MELVLTEKRGGGYQAHRPTCKKIGDKEQFDAEELTTEALGATTPCSSCKPKETDMDSMLASTPPAEDKPMNPAPEGEDDEDWVDDDLLGDDDDDLLGDEPVVEKPKPRDPPKPKPAPKASAPKTSELKEEEALGLLDKVAGHLGITLPSPLTFPGFGKAVKTPNKETVYLNSKGTADVRGNSPEQAAEWVEQGLAEKRGGNYVRVAVRDL